MHFTFKRDCKPYAVDDIYAPRWGVPLTVTQPSGGDDFGTGLSLPSLLDSQSSSPKWISPKWVYAAYWGYEDTAFDSVWNKQRYGTSDNFTDAKEMKPDFFCPVEQSSLYYVLNDGKPVRVVVYVDGVTGSIPLWLHFVQKFDDETWIRVVLSKEKVINSAKDTSWNYCDEHANASDCRTSHGQQPLDQKNSALTKMFNDTFCKTPEDIVLSVPNMIMYIMPSPPADG